jgi:hypothetical protein
VSALHLIKYDNYAGNTLAYFAGASNTRKKLYYIDTRAASAGKGIIGTTEKKLK